MAVLGREPFVQGVILSHNPNLSSMVRGPAFQNQAQPASSRERRVAAAIARVNNSSKPPGPINTSRAAAVVPPGEVTFFRKTAAPDVE